MEGMSHAGLHASFGVGVTEDAPTGGGQGAMAMQKAVERARKLGSVAPRFKAAIHVTEALVAHGAERQEIDVDTRHQALTVLDDLLALNAPEAIIVSGSAGPFLERRFDLWEVDQPRRHFVLGGHVRTRLGLGGGGGAVRGPPEGGGPPRRRLWAAPRGRAPGGGPPGRGRHRQARAPA